MRILYSWKSTDLLPNMRSVMSKWAILVLILIETVLLCRVASGGQEAKKEIYKGLSHVFFPWPAPSMYVLRKNAEAIAWVEEHTFPKGALITASTVGKGRVVLVAGNKFLENRLTNSEYNQVFRRLVNWASRGAVNSTVNLDEVKCKLGNIKGTFHWFSYKMALNTTEMKQLLKSVKKGRMNLIVAVNDMGPTSEFLVPLLKVAGVHVTERDDYVNAYNANASTTADLLNCSIDSMEEALQKLPNASSEYFKCTVLHTFMAISYATEQERKELGATPAQLRRILEGHRKHAEGIMPSLNRKPQSKDFNWVWLYNRLYIDKYALVDTNFTAPYLDNFPGEVDFSKMQLLTVELAIDERYGNEWMPTGYYLPPSVTATVEVLNNESTTADKWVLLIGCWTRDLKFNHGQWKRYPEATMSFPLQNKFKVFSAFGGSVQIYSMKGGRKTVLRVRISNVIEAPYMSLRDPKTIGEWDARVKRSVAPWADLVGDQISMCLPVYQVRDQSSAQMEHLLRNVWDMHVKLSAEFMGLRTDDDRRARFYVDKQLVSESASGISGYPISVLDWYFDARYNDSWTLCHELGHNRMYHHGEITPNGYGHVINELPCLVSKELIYKQNRSIHGGSLLGYFERVTTFIRAGAPYLGEGWFGLGAYEQIAYHFGMGAISRWLHTYSKDRKLPNPRTNQEVIDQWVLRMSNITGMNLMPMFDFWSFPVSDWARKQPVALPCFLPLDPWTKLDNSSRYVLLSKKYEGKKCVGKALPYIPYPKMPNTYDVLPLDMHITAVYPANKG